MSDLKVDGITASTGTNTDLDLSGKGTGKVDIAAGFKVGGASGVPTASIQDDAITLAKLASGTDGELITWDASGNPATVAVGTATHALTSNGAGAAPTFQAVSAGFTLGTEQATTSGTAITFSGIPSGTTIVVVMLDGVSSNGTGQFNITLGDSGGLETSGYIGATNAGHSSTRHNIQDTINTGNIPLTGNSTGNVAAETYQGAITFTLMDSSNNQWIATGQLGTNSTGYMQIAGSKSLSGVLTQLSVFTADTFDAGSVNIMYQ